MAQRHPPIAQKDRKASLDGEKIVEAIGLTKIFSDFWLRAKARAVDGIDFEIRRGEIFGLLGPNGSGKSTTIKMLLGLLHKTKGRLLVFGKDPSDVIVKQRIGYLPEESYMYRFLNPEETLDYYAKLFGIARRERARRVGELLEMVGLQHVRHRAVGEFSKGMTRRLGLAQALVNDPEFLILDEPTSGLDPIGTRQVKDLLLELGRRGKTVLLSSHLLDDVEDVCDRMVVLYGGRIRAAGTADELLTDTSRTVITTTRLSSDTIARVDRLLQDTQGVGVDSIASPRERLEDFFMDLVEKARQEQIVTSGAQHGGRTASFLAEHAEREPGALIEDLTRDRDAATVRSVEVASHTPAPSGPRVDVLQDLLNEKKTEQAPRPAPARGAPPKPTDVDSSVIDDLLGDGKAGGGSSDGGRRE